MQKVPSTETCGVVGKGAARTGARTTGKESEEEGLCDGATIYFRYATYVTKNMKN